MTVPVTTQDIGVQAVKPVDQVNGFQKFKGAINRWRLGPCGHQVQDVIRTDRFPGGADDVENIAAWFGEPGSQFMVRMTHAFEMKTDMTLIEPDVADMIRHDDQRYDMRASLPHGVEAYQLRGPLFFGVSSRLLDVLDQMIVKPKIFILRLGQVPMIDSSGETALEEFIRRCHRANIRVILTGVQPEPMKIMRAMNLFKHYPDLILTANFAEGIKKAEAIIAAEGNG